MTPSSPCGPPGRSLAALALCALLVVGGCTLFGDATSSGEADAALTFPFQPEAPPRYETDGVRLATLNAEFLFDGEGNEGQARFDWKGDPEAARAHRDAVGAVIRMLNADLLVLQEVENAEVLEMMRSESLEGMGYTAHFVPGADTFTGQDVALLARVPVEAVGRTDERAPVGTSGDDYGVSKNMYARLNLAGTPTTLVGVHFLARPDDPGRTPRREAQAEVIRRLVAQEVEAGRAVAVLGDFNDFDGRTPDVAGNAPITDVLEIVKRAGDGTEDDLMSVMPEVPPHERFTSHYDRNRNGIVDDRNELSAIDHVLLSPALYAEVAEVTYVQAHDPAAATDHFPIVVTFGR